MGGCGDDVGGSGNAVARACAHEFSLCFVELCRIVSIPVDGELGDCRLWIADCKVSPLGMVSLSGHSLMVAREFCFVKYGAGGSRLRGNDVGGCGNDGEWASSAWVARGMWRTKRPCVCSHAAHRGRVHERVPRVRACGREQTERAHARVFAVFGRILSRPAEGGRGRIVDCRLRIA